MLQFSLLVRKTKYFESSYKTLLSVASLLDVGSAVALQVVLFNYLILVIASANCLRCKEFMLLVLGI